MQSYKGVIARFHLRGNIFNGKIKNLILRCVMKKKIKRIPICMLGTKWCFVNRRFPSNKVVKNYLQLLVVKRVEFQVAKKSGVEITNRSSQEVWPSELLGKWSLKRNIHKNNIKLYQPLQILHELHMSFNTLLKKFSINYNNLMILKRKQNTSELFFIHFEQYF